MGEDAVLLQVALEQALAYFEERDRQILRLYFRLHEPDDYTGVWPPTYESVGDYVGRRLLGEPITEGSVRYRVEVALERLKTLL